nr:MAG TPA: hypothetical protein [Caudoviricetes sp.]
MKPCWLCLGISHISKIQLKKGCYHGKLNL